MLQEREPTLVTAVLNQRKFQTGHPALPRTQGVQDRLIMGANGEFATYSEFSVRIPESQVAMHVGTPELFLQSWLVDLNAVPRGVGGANFASALRFEAHAVFPQGNGMLSAGAILAVGFRMPHAGGAFIHPEPWLVHEQMRGTDRACRYIVREAADTYVILSALTTTAKPFGPHAPVVRCPIGGSIELGFERVKGASATSTTPGQTVGDQEPGVVFYVRTLEGADDGIISTHVLPQWRAAWAAFAQGLAERFLLPVQLHAAPSVLFTNQVAGIARNLLRGIQGRQDVFHSFITDKPRCYTPP